MLKILKFKMVHLTFDPRPKGTTSLIYQKRRIIPYQHREVSTKTPPKTNRIISADTHLVNKNVSQWIYYQFYLSMFFQSIIKLSAVIWYSDFHEINCSGLIFQWHSDNYIIYFLWIIIFKECVDRKWEKLEWIDGREVKRQNIPEIFCINIRRTRNQL